MTIELIRRDKDETLNRVLILWLYRICALVLFALGISHWARLTGMAGDPQMRFDLMPVWWRMTAPFLAVFYPIAGVGLWMAVTWGAVLWGLVAAIEIIMHVEFRHLFGPAGPVLIFHILGLATLLALKLVGWREARLRGKTPRARRSIKQQNHSAAVR